MEDIGEPVGGIKRSRDTAKAAEIEQHVLPKLVNVSDFAKRHKREVQHIQMALSTKLMLSNPSHEPRIAVSAAPNLRRRTNSHQRRQIPAQRRIVLDAKKAPDGAARYRATRRKHSQLDSDWYHARQAWANAVLCRSLNSADISSSPSTALRLPLHRWHAKRMVLRDEFGVFEPVACQGRGSKAAIEDSRADATIQDCSSAVTVQLTGLLSHLIKVLDFCAGDMDAALGAHDSNEAAAEALGAEYSTPAGVMGRAASVLQLRPPLDPPSTSTQEKDVLVYHGPVTVLWSGAFAECSAAGTPPSPATTLVEELRRRHIALDPEATQPSQWLQHVSCVQLQCSPCQASALSAAVAAACVLVCPASQPETSGGEAESKDEAARAPWDTSLCSALCGTGVHGTLEVAQQAVFHLRGAMALPLLRRVLVAEQESGAADIIQRAPWSVRDLASRNNCLLRGQWGVVSPDSIHGAAVNDGSAALVQAGEIEQPRAVVALDTSAGAVKVTVDASAAAALSQAPHCTQVHSTQGGLLAAAAASAVHSGRTAPSTVGGANVRAAARRRRHVAARSAARHAAAGFDEAAAAKEDLKSLTFEACGELLQPAGAPALESCVGRVSMSLQLLRGSAKGGGGRGVVLRAPQAFGATLWQALVFAGAKPLGCAEAADCSTVEGRADFPRDFPDTPAGWSWWRRQEADKNKKNKKHKPDARHVLLWFEQLAKSVEAAEPCTAGSLLLNIACTRVRIKLVGTQNRGIRAGSRVYIPLADEFILWKDAKQRSSLRELRIAERAGRRLCAVVTAVQYSHATACVMSIAVAATSAIYDLQCAVESGLLAGRARRHAWPVLVDAAAVSEKDFGLNAAWLF